MHGTGYSDINGTLRSMIKVLRYLLIHLWLDAKITGEITVSNAAIPRAMREVAQVTVSSKPSWRFLDTTAQGRVVSDKSHNTCRPSFLPFRR